jgi:ribosome recycling factor|tara:strand:- start:668 stop:1219 length:552 start_codon:yes stop_codon:yes gene_type:complete
MFNDKTYKDKMIKTLELFSKELASLRTGRANASMLDLVKVDVYGQKMPINQLATISVPEPRTINVQVWDINNVPLIDSSIRKSELGLNPQIDGQLLRLPIPDLNEERRSELKKIIKSTGEKCKVSIRNIRREANDEIKRLLKSKELSEDDEKKAEKNIQNITDENIKIIDDKVVSKEKEIMTI